MRRFALTFSVCALGICAPAAQANSSNSHSGAPAGNSGINQYVESIPTDNGNRPTNGVHSTHTGGGGGTTGGGGSGTGGASGGSSGSGTSSGSGAGSAVSQSTQRALASHGADGRAAAALARNTAPQRSAAPRPSSTSDPGGAVPLKASGGSSALGSLAAALTGSGSTGGLGTWLPVILIVVLFGSATMAILRRRSHT